MEEFQRKGVCIPISVYWLVCVCPLVFVCECVCVCLCAYVCPPVIMCVSVCGRMVLPKALLRDGSPPPGIFYNTKAHTRDVREL